MTEWRLMRKKRSAKQKERFNANEVANIDGHGAFEF